MTIEPGVFGHHAVDHEVNAALCRSIPEIAHGVINVVAVAREPGISCKVAVTATVPGVETKATCIGKGGSRIHSVEALLGGERIGVVEYHDNPCRYVRNALTVPSISADVIDLHGHKIRIVVHPGDLFARAIGRSGTNVRLASRLTGWHIQLCTPLCQDGQCIHPRFGSQEMAS